MPDDPVPDGQGPDEQGPDEQGPDEQGPVDDVGPAQAYRRWQAERVEVCARGVERAPGAVLDPIAARRLDALLALVTGAQHDLDPATLVVHLRVDDLDDLAARPAAPTPDTAQAPEPDVAEPPGVAEPDVAEPDVAAVHPILRSAPTAQPPSVRSATLGPGTRRRNLRVPRMWRHRQPGGSSCAVVVS